MATKQKLTKATKREMVVPFNDEHNFIVPKRGGFGQPDNENFVMVVGNYPTTVPSTPSQEPPYSLDNTNTTAIPIGTPSQPISPSTTTTNTNPTPAEPNPSTITTPPLATPEQLCVAPNMWVNGQCIQGGVEQSPAELTCINSGGAWINGACVTSTSPKTLATTTTTVTDTPIVDTLPTFPVWSSLDCTTLKDKIAEYNAILSTSRFSQAIVDAYNTAIATAQGIYNGKCNATPTPTTPPIAVIDNSGKIGGGGGFGGGGGGGLGEPPSSDEVPQEEEKGKFNWLLILAIIGGIYLLSKKSK
jgi:hypothetical protein